MSTIFVKKRDGSRELFNADKINKSILRACEGLDDVVQKVTKIATETRLVLYDGITTDELDRATIDAAVQNIIEDVEYDKVATRLLLKTVYRKVVRDGDHGLAFVGYIETGVFDGLLDKRMKELFDLRVLAAHLDTSRDDLFQYAGLSTLLHRYAVKGKDGCSKETPQFFFMRVAMGLSYNETNPTEQAKKFYDRMSQFFYLAGGSTNIGAGTTRPALSNCFLLEIHDDIDHIAKSVSDVIKISKATGGIGASMTKLRATGSPLSSNNTVSTGPTPFAKIIDTAIRAIARGGKKKGALCFYMENWHLDFSDYIDWKHNAGDDYLRMRTANTAVFISDEFMKRVSENREWYMFDPKETADLNELYGKAFSERYAYYVLQAEAGKMRVFKKVPAREQFFSIIASLQSTSHPWLTFKDAINLRALNNNTGTIHMSNLCTEVCLPQDRDNIAVCNLASLNISAHIREGVVLWETLEDTVRTAIRQLDNLIDINILPIPEATKSDRENRAVGLGMMGFAEALEKIGLSYDSPRTFDFADEVFEFISYMAIDESANLAATRGAYQHFVGSGWSKGRVPCDTLSVLERERGVSLSVPVESVSEKLDWDALRVKVKKGMRNATLMAVAPNANIGLVAGTTPGIDPRFSQVFSRNKVSGKYVDINHNLVFRLVRLGIWDAVRPAIVASHGDLSDIAIIPQSVKDVYKTSFTVSPHAYIEVAARAQKWVDQALSRNMYLATRNTEEIMNIYAAAWAKGVKTTYYLHMKPQHTAEQSTVRVNKSVQTGKVGFGVLARAPSAQSVEQRVTLAGFKTCPIDPQERSQCDSCQ